MSQFLAPCSIQGDAAFGRNHFAATYDEKKINFRPLPPRLHHKTFAESKHRIIREINIRLKSSNPDDNIKLLIHRAMHISNDLYGSDIASAHELAKGCTRPIEQDNFFKLPPDIRYEELIAKRKLTSTLRAQRSPTNNTNAGDIFQVYIKPENPKRGKCSVPKPALKFESLI